MTWFDGSDSRAAAPPRSRMVASRWVGHAPDGCEQGCEIAEDYHVVGIALQPMGDVTVFSGGKLIDSGDRPRRSVRLNQPGLRLRGIFRGEYDVVHLHIPNQMIYEYHDPESNQLRATPLIANHLTVDVVIEKLARFLIHTEALGGALGQSHADGISLAIAAQLFRGISDHAAARRPHESGLSKWRLKRATEYIAANLAEPITLAAMAAAAGLSRMHFAAQFRASTGLRPHEFLLQKRIERAQALLSGSFMPLVEIALEVAFMTQSHFTTVFARFVGETPHLWRQRRYSAADACPQVSPAAGENGLRSHHAGSPESERPHPGSLS